MEQIFMITPYIVSIAGLLFHSFLLLGKIWIPEYYSSNNEIKQLFYSVGKSVFYPLYLGFGIIFLNVSIAWIFGIYGYTNFRFHGPSIIFGIILGLIYVLGVFQINPKKWKYILGSIYIAIFVYFLNWRIASYESLSKGSIELFVLMGISIGIPVIVSILLNFYKVLTKKHSIGNENQEGLEGPESSEKLLEKNTSVFRFLFSTKMNLVLWILLLIEVILKFYGSSLFIGI
jgi:hypothetical protein